MAHAGGELGGLGAGAGSVFADSTKRHASRLRFLWRGLASRPPLRPRYLDLDDRAARVESAPAPPARGRVAEERRDDDQRGALSSDNREIARHQMQSGPQVNEPMRRLWASSVWIV